MGMVSSSRKARQRRKAAEIDTNLGAIREGETPGPEEDRAPGSTCLALYVILRRMERAIPGRRGELRISRQNRQGLRIAPESGMRWGDGGCLAQDARGDMGLFKAAVPGVDEDGAAEEEEDVDLEFSGEGDGKPDAVGLGGIDDGKTQAGDVGAEQNADRERESGGRARC